MDLGKRVDGVEERLMEEVNSQGPRINTIIEYRYTI